MIKTAEEILLQCCAGPEASPVWSHEEALDAMREFAAQEVAKEVKAYKERLKEAVKHTILNERSSDLLTGRAIYELIDTVK